MVFVKRINELDNENVKKSNGSGKTAVPRVEGRMPCWGNMEEKKYIPEEASGLIALGNCIMDEGPFGVRYLVGPWLPPATTYGCAGIIGVGGGAGLAVSASSGRSMARPLGCTPPAYPGVAGRVLLSSPQFGGGRRRLDSRPSGPQ